MGLFFLAVGMSLNFGTVLAYWPLLVAMLVAFVRVKAVAIYLTARAFGSANRVALVRTAMFAQAGEFPSGAGEAEVIIICVDNRRAASAIVELARQEFPNATLLARSYDRGHSMELIRAGVDVEVRETVESALAMGTRRFAGWAVPRLPWLRRWRTSAGETDFLHAANYLVDLENAVIGDVEATAPIRQAENKAARDMIGRTLDRFDLYPERLVADTAYGGAEMLAWLVHEQGIEPHRGLRLRPARGCLSLSRRQVAAPVPAAVPNRAQRRR